MALCFKDFVKDKIDSNLLDYWTDTIIQQVEVNQSESVWRINLIIPRPIPASIICAVETQLTAFHNYLDHLHLIPVLAKASNDLYNTIADRQSDLAESLSKDGVCLLSMPELGWDCYPDRIDLVSSNLDLYEWIIANGSCSCLSDWFKKEYALNILVRAIYQGERIVDQGNHNLQAGRDLELIAPVNHNGSLIKNGFNHKDRLRIVKTIKGNSMPVAELEEGLKTAIIEGEVWDKKVFAMKDGRWSVHYFLTDYEDSIAVKTFYSTIEEDQIKVGEFIKVKGSVRFDQRIDEPVLMLDQVCRLEKILRQDQAKDKRIELHAHTKMSAMDGLTEIKDLVSRASEWGHQAVAITDHGCMQAFPVAYSMAQELNKKTGRQLKIIYGVEGYLVEEDKKERPHHIIILARNLVGLKNLYKLVSLSYMEYFYRQPRIPRHQLTKYREGLLLGTACEAGELFRALLRGADQPEIDRIVSFYDYLEIQPRSNNAFLLRNGQVESEDDLLDLNRQIVQLGLKYGKPVVATGDVHFLEPHHEKFRTIIKTGQDYEDAEEELPLYFRTTSEMLEEFAYLGKAQANRVVIESPRMVADLIEHIKPVPDGFYPPKIDSAEQEITELTWLRARACYGDPLPAMVQDRIEKELASIIGNGFAVLYSIASKLVAKSNQDGYLVGSRGSVGSSLVAFFTGITEVNALPPHYLCRSCHYHKFVENLSVGCGADLADKTCPNCGAELHKDGFNIPFETFMGFEGDKVPDIDLNFSGDYQSRAHQYVEEIFGSQNVFRAGTISTIADKIALGFVRKFAEKQGIELKVSEMHRLAKGITGVRKTTGQHPGGLIVVPTDKNILDFTPIQHPANNKDSGIVTTHFEYHAIGDQLVKLDILGHDDPTVIRELEDLTGVKATGISLSEPQTMKLFSGIEPLGVKAEEIDSTIGTYGIPEFGTPFVRQMLEATRPTTFAELVRISGLSHGTDVWVNNAHSLISDRIAGLSEVICTRDDIMTYLINQKMDKVQAFDIMEKVRKGKGLNQQEVDAMEKCAVPSWYIGSCQKIKYMFPKAHAVAYVTMAYRIAWFKIYYPLPFYASFFGIRAEDFEASTILSGYDEVRRRIKEIAKMGYNASQKERKLQIILELAMEMYARGFHFRPVNIYRSDARRFIADGKGLILPFAALPNIGLSAAQGIVNSRYEGEYLSIEDFQNRTRLNKSAMEMLRQENCFQDLPEKTQLSLFG